VTLDIPLKMAEAQLHVPRRAFVTNTENWLMKEWQILTVVFGCGFEMELKTFKPRSRNRVRQSLLRAVSIGTYWNVF